MSDRHEDLATAPWSEAIARETIHEIVTESVAAFSKDSLFPTHPREELDSDNAGSSYYFGAGGVLWALDYLRRRGVAEVDTGWLVDGLTAIVQKNEAGAISPLGVAYLFGDLPMLLQLVALTGEQIWRDRAQRLIESSLAAPVQELMWGTPGVLIATALIEDQSLRAAVEATDRGNLAKLLRAWSYEIDGLTVWKEELYGQQRLFVGPVHGFAGQVLPLLKRLDELDTNQRRLTLARSKAFLSQTAVRQDGRANWPAILPDNGDDDTTSQLPVQYCHGAPGVVISFCDYPPDPEVDAVLLEGGELVWQAGPLVKGSNLCHGTGGNGYTFLKLFERTGDTKWLDRARIFAMHGIGQYRSELAQVGRPRFSLWTGDPGFAIYLASCIDGDASFPTVDVF